MRRIERLINLIAALLETERPLTADEIRERIAGYDQPNHEAFRRAFERDKEHLRSMGIPLEVVPTDVWADQADGYIIPKERYYLPDLDLEPDELAALSLAADAVLGAGEEARSGLLKLSLDAGAEPVRGPRLMWGADVAAEQPVLTAVYATVIERSPVSFSYETAAGDTSARNLNPYALVHRRGNWYVIGHDRDRDALRAFRLSRIRSEIARVDGTYEVPKDFDPHEHLPKEAFEVGAGETETARIAFAAHLRWWVEQNMPESLVDASDVDEVVIEVAVANLDALVSWVLGFGSDARILEPADARRALLDHLRPFTEASAP